MQLTATSLLGMRWACKPSQYDGCVLHLAFPSILRGFLLGTVLQIMFRASTTGTLGTRREIVECLAVLCTEFPSGVEALLPTLSPDAVHKLLSVVEAVIESTRDHQTTGLCADMLKVFAKVFTHYIPYHHICNRL